MSRSSRGKNERYVPPALDDTADFVTQPPRGRGLTGSISKLFRREASRERRQKISKPESVEADDERSVDLSVASRQSKQRIFYSADDDDDSYESRVSKTSRVSQNKNDEDETDESAATSRTILRYRGFSTSIKHLFLDESLVCASMGCFGLVLSNRTEYLLQLRNEKRGTLSPRSRNKDATHVRSPSRAIAWALLVTLSLVFLSYLVGGFGAGNTASASAMNGNNYNNYNNNNYNNNGGQQGDDANQNNNNYNNAWQDDWLQANQNNYAKNKYKNNDDGSNSNYNKNNNKSYSRYQGTYWDRYKNRNNDDGNNDDGNNNYYQKNDDGYNKNNGNRRARTVSPNNYYHRALGVFKLRDVQESIWSPMYNAVLEEYKAEQENTIPRHRRQEQQQNYNGGYYDDYYIEEMKHQRDFFAIVRMAVFFVFFLFLGIIGRRRRMRTRFYLVRARAQEDQLFYASSDVGAAHRLEDTREDQYEGACSHTLCGCYPVDEITEEDVQEEVEVTDSGIFLRKRKPQHEDFVARGFNCLMDMCCGVMVKCWFQCMSVCALAQEAREIRLLVPPRYQRVDFITHQPFHEYDKDVNALRSGWLGKTRRKAGIVPHWNALSRLSRYILLVFLVSTAAIITTLVFNPRATFSWQDVAVLIATFLQSFLVLFVVHWIFHKSDLSLDAVIKLFAAGFVIAVPSAVIFENILVNLILFMAWTGYETLDLIFKNSFADWVFSNWRMIWLFGELFNAFIVAAVTEELCKYYTFRTVEHPDLLFLTGLNRFKQDENAVDGGVVKYPFGSHQVQELNRENSFESRTSQKSRRIARSKSRERTRKEELLNREDDMDKTEFDQAEDDIRTYRQKAMAITTGMICVAVGLACAENFLYVFVLGGVSASVHSEEEHQGDIMEEWIVLFFRSIFPIHALAAAMQSINMIRKFVESENDIDGRRVGVGRIVLPAILLHGSFDAVLMAINVFVETSWDEYLDANGGNVGNELPYNALLVNMVAWISLSLIMFVGILWYYKEFRNQRHRLILLEEKEKAKVSSENPDWNAQQSEVV